MTESDLLSVLQTVPDPYGASNFVSTRRVKNIRVTDEHVAFEVALGYPARRISADLSAQLVQAAQSLSGVASVQVDLNFEVQAHAVQRGIALLPTVKNIIAVASAKGGVGKSTTAVNLALALSNQGARVGLLDADIYGPSVPTMLGLAGLKPESLDGKTMEPLERYGVQVSSMGFLVEPDTAMIWRGPMATQALDQLLRQTRWRELDYLIVDMPPGTGDIQLSLSQRVPVTGAVVVTTPQDIALLDALRGVNMFKKVNVPVLGLIDNMAMHICTQCGHHEAIFGQDGGKRLAEQAGLTYLGALPLALRIREQADAGIPMVVSDPDGAIAKIYTDMALKIAAKIALQAKDYSAKLPPVTVSNE